MPRQITLSAKALQAIEAASHGMTSPEIAKEMNTTAAALNQIIWQACMITGTANRTELVALALRQKWIR